MELDSKCVAPLYWDFGGPVPSFVDEVDEVILEIAKRQGVRTSVEFVCDTCREFITWLALQTGMKANGKGNAVDEQWAPKWSSMYPEIFDRLNKAGKLPAIR
jgi:hypothetical protein